MPAMEYYGTLGPACASVDCLAEMFEAGMTGMRRKFEAAARTGFHFVEKSALRRSFLL